MCLYGHHVVLVYTTYTLQLIPSHTYNVCVRSRDAPTICRITNMHVACALQHFPLPCVPLSHACCLRTYALSRRVHTFFVCLMRICPTYHNLPHVVCHKLCHHSFMLQPPIVLHHTAVCHVAHTCMPPRGA